MSPRVFWRLLRLLRLQCAVDSDVLLCFLCSPFSMVMQESSRKTQPRVLPNLRRDWQRAPNTPSTRPATRRVRHKGEFEDEADDDDEGEPPYPTKHPGGSLDESGTAKR
jgi:hypothetical protein